MAAMSRRRRPGQGVKVGKAAGSTRSAGARGAGARTRGSRAAGAATRFSSRRQPESYRGAVNRLGSDNLQSKLTEADVRKCKALFRRGATVGELASEYGVHASTMSRALRGLTFGHVAGTIARAKPTRGRSRR